MLLPSSIHPICVAGLIPNAPTHSCSERISPRYYVLVASINPTFPCYLRIHHPSAMRPFIAHHARGTGVDHAEHLSARQAEGLRPKGGARQNDVDYGD